MVDVKDVKDVKTGFKLLRFMGKIPFFSETEWDATSLDVKVNILRGVTKTYIMGITHEVAKATLSFARKELAEQRKANKKAIKAELAQLDPNDPEYCYKKSMLEFRLSPESRRKGV